MLPVGQPVAVLFAHAARDDGFRVGGQHGFVIQSGHQPFQPAKHVLAAAQGHHLANQMFVTDAHQRFVPYLVKGGYRVAFAVARGERGHAVSELAGRLSPYWLGTGQPGESFDGVGDGFHAARLDVEHRHAQRFQGLHLLGGVAGHPADDQVRRQPHQRFQVDARVAAYRGHLFGFRGVVAVAHHRHHLIPRPGGPGQLGGPRRERGDTVGGGVQAHLPVAIIHRAARMVIPLGGGRHERKREAQGPACQCVIGQSEHSGTLPGQR